MTHPLTDWMLNDTVNIIACVVLVVVAAYPLWRLAATAVRAVVEKARGRNP